MLSAFYLAFGEGGVKKGGNVIQEKVIIMQHIPSFMHRKLKEKEKGNESVRTVERGGGVQCRVTRGAAGRERYRMEENRGRHNKVQACKGAGDRHTDTPHRLVN